MEVNVEVTGEEVGELDRDVDAGPTLPYPGERLVKVVVTAST